MPKYMLITDNEDGTTTFKTNINGEDSIFVVPMALEDLISGMVQTQHFAEVAETYDAMIIPVPNEV
jgi:hypothetical protein